jgi:hypothetical protein
MAPGSNGNHSFTRGKDLVAIGDCGCIFSANSECWSAFRHTGNAYSRCRTVLRGISFLRILFHSIILSQVFIADIFELMGGVAEQGAG